MRRLMLRNASGGGGILPAEYQQVEWIQATANGQHFRTGLYVADNVNKVAILAKVYQESNSGEKIISYNYPASESSLELAFSSTKNKIIFYSHGVSASITDSSIYNGICDLYAEIDYQASAKTLQVTTQSQSFTDTKAIASADRPASEFCILYPSLNFKGRLYRISYEFDGTTVACYIPCYRKADGVIGVYDTISETFIEPRGGGKFIKGADVN